MNRTCQIIGAPIDSGSARPGCLMGPAALRTAGLIPAARSLGWIVTDRGDLRIPDQPPLPHANAAVHHLAETCAWTEALSAEAETLAGATDLTIFLGGDHSMSAGTIAGMARHAARAGRPLFVLWLDAHTDFHSPDTSASGNLHGTPVAYVTGQPGFADFPALAATVDPGRIAMMGIRSVDPAERDRILTTDIAIHDMRAIDEAGVLRPLKAFLARIRAANGLLHVSLDVDFLDPGIAPAVGTTVPGGATFREAHLIMECLGDSGLVASLDLAELNPFLDERGRTATLMADLAASLMGRRVLDRPTPGFAA
ncbi:MAG: arginase [Marinibacterium sp.]